LQAMLQEAYFHAIFFSLYHGVDSPYVGLAMQFSFTLYKILPHTSHQHTASLLNRPYD